LKIANVLIADSWGDINPEALEKGIGGREGAMIYLSHEWAKAGHEVTSFVPAETGKRFYAVPDIKVTGRFKQHEPTPVFKKDVPGAGFHEYVPLNLTKPMLANFDWDVAIAWECPTAFDDKRIQDRIKLRITEMQVAHLSNREAQAAERNTHYLAALSDWHGKFLQHSGIEFDDDHVKVFPNGVSIERYPKEAFERKLKTKANQNPRFVYSSSPDRGLWYLLQSWPYIREEFPNAELSVCYGVEKWVELLKWSHGRTGEMALGIEELIDQPGVNNLGKIGQGRLSELQMEADAWLYPLDSIQSTETGCITAVENAAAGNPIITTDCDCMEDEFGKIGTIVDLPITPEEYAAKVIEVLNDQDLVEYQREIGREFAENRDWGLISKQWLQLFNDQN
jgi:glycosyltransferase involved in cell wall biosynthesis